MDIGKLDLIALLKAPARRIPPVAFAALAGTAAASATTYSNTWNGYHYCSGTDGYTSYQQKSFQGYDIGSDNRGNSWFGHPDGRGGESWEFKSHRD